jgi:hypothetical protein
MKKATRGLPFLRVLLPSTASSPLVQFLDGRQLSRRLRQVDLRLSVVKGAALSFIASSAARLTYSKIVLNLSCRRDGIIASISRPIRMTSKS